MRNRECTWQLRDDLRPREVRGSDVLDRRRSASGGRSDEAEHERDEGESSHRRRMPEALRWPPMSQVLDPRVDIGHVHLKVADLDRALAFWRDTLGFEEQARSATRPRSSPQAATTITSA